MTEFLAFRPNDEISQAWLEDSSICVKCEGCGTVWTKHLSDEELDRIKYLSEGCTKDGSRYDYASARAFFPSWTEQEMSLYLGYHMCPACYEELFSNICK